MRIAVRRVRAGVDPRGELQAPRTIALPKPGAVAPFVRRRPARRLQAPLDVPAVSRIVLRSFTLR